MPPRQSVHPWQAYFIMKRISARRRQHKRNGERVPIVEVVRGVCYDFKIPKKRVHTVYAALWLMQNEWVLHVPIVTSRHMRRVARVTSSWLEPAYGLPTAVSGDLHMVSHRDVLDIELTRLHADPVASLVRAKQIYSIYGVQPGALDRIVDGNRLAFRV